MGVCQAVSSPGSSGVQTDALTACGHLIFMLYSSEGEVDESAAVRTSPANGVKQHYFGHLDVLITDVLFESVIVTVSLTPT